MKRRYPTWFNDEDVNSAKPLKVKAEVRKEIYKNSYAIRPLQIPHFTFILSHS
jgi:hypothetical protein